MYHQKFILSHNSELSVNNRFQNQFKSQLAKRLISRSSKSRSKQLGLSMIGLIIVVILLGFVGMIAIEVIPSISEFSSVQRAMKKAASESTPEKVRDVFDRAISTQNVKTVTSKNLDIQAVNGSLKVSIAYNVEVHLFGNAYFVMKYADKTK